jgi:hypothetical protein
MGQAEIISLPEVRARKQWAAQVEVLVTEIPEELKAAHADMDV